MLAKFALAVAALGALTAVFLLGTTVHSVAEASSPAPQVNIIQEVDASNGKLSFTQPFCVMPPAGAPGKLYIAFTNAKTKKPVGRILGEYRHGSAWCFTYKTPTRLQLVRVTALFVQGLKKPGKTWFVFRVVAPPPRP